MVLAMIVAMIPIWSVTANAASDYGLVVDYAKVTSDRTSGDGWSYNPATNTLTLTNYSYSGSVKNVGVEDTPRISEPLSFFEKTLFSSAPTGVSHR